MSYIKTDFSGLWVIEPKIFEDSRGYFYESFNQKNFYKNTGLDIHFVQDNQSLSNKGVLRGLHFQEEPMAQAKLVSVLRGEVLDIAVDLRSGSPTFGSYFKIVLSATKKNQVFIPRGFAHGFLVLSDMAEFYYKCDNYYAPDYEDGIIFNDKKLSVDWEIPFDKLVISEKDMALPKFQLKRDYFSFEVAV